MKLAVFIDYDNLLNPHRSLGILDVVRRALFQTPLSASTERGTCDIRIYGGWYEGSSLTRRAQDLITAINEEFPENIRIPLPERKVITVSTNAELAFSMMEEPSHHLLDTYRKKGRPANLRVEKPETVGCTDSVCPLPLARKLLKNGCCPVPSCTIESEDLVYRHEQKIVDTMLTCDIVYAPQQNYNHLILISGDDDFLPPIRTVLLRGILVSRFHPRPNRIRTPLVVRGAQLTDVDL